MVEGREPLAASALRPPLPCLAAGSWLDAEFAFKVGQDRGIAEQYSAADFEVRKTLPFQPVVNRPGRTAEECRKFAFRE